ncbi:hypothetical protein [Microtetraspora malaysiensis]|uniref:hypothetical protein n=1 Tax=Microtetraspora malaysiensis TaxID=161358 RepID=UPI0009FF57D3|nr:hypothetical protein [Microtetraspora malaysiensis]
MQDDAVWSAYLERTRDLAEQLLRANDPYDVGLELMGETIEVFTIGDWAGSMYTLWGDLTDWVELKPAEEELAQAEMVRAAREWLALNPRDSDAVGRYFDHWLYDVFGHDQLYLHRGRSQQTE